MLKLPLVLLLLLSSSLFAQEPIVSQEPVTDDSSTIPLVAPENLTGQSSHIEGAPATKVQLSLEEESTSSQSEFVPPEGYSVQTGSQYGLQLKEHTVSMVTGSFKPKPGIEPNLQTAIALGEVEYALIQIDKESQVSEELFNRIHSLGVETFGELPGLAWQAKIPAKAIFDLVNIPEVRWVGHIPTDMKSIAINSDIEVEDFQAVVSLMGDDWVEGQQTVAFSIENESGPEMPEEPVVFSTYLTNGAFQSYLESVGLKPIVYYRNTRSFLVEGDVSKIIKLASLPSVSFIHPAGVTKLEHDESVPFIGQDYVRSSWDGSGSHLGIIDSEVMLGTSGGVRHTDFNTVNSVAWDNTGDGAGTNPAPNAHGTHVAGTMIGDGTADSRFEGTASGVGDSGTSRFFHGRFFDRNNNAVGDVNNLYNALSSDFTDGAGTVAKRPDVINNSWGTTYSSGGVQVTTSGTFQQAIDVDARVWDGQTYVFAAGNDGAGGMVGEEGCAKNVLTVANAWGHESTPGDNTAGDLNPSSSQGPTGDNRMRPEITAAGTWINSTDGNNVPNGYQSLSGTSMASPHVSGVLAALSQRYSVLEGNPKLMRAWIKASALKKGGGDAPDSQYGFGYINANRAHYVDSAWALSYWSNESVDSSTIGGHWTYHDITIDAGTERLIVVVNWDEPALTTTGASTPILADVELRIDWDNNQSGGQTGNVSSTGADNQQFIIVDNPPAGSHRIKVYGVDTRLNGLFAEELDYSLVMVKEEGDVRPVATLLSAFEDNTIKSSDTATLTSTASVSDFIGTNAMFNVLDDGGLTMVGKTLTLKDGKVISQSGNDKSSMFGVIAHTGTRSIDTDFSAPGEGTYTVQTKLNIDNGPSSFGDSDYENTTLIVDDTAPAEVSSLSSSTHAINVWTNSASADFSWSAATDALSGVDGYGLFTTSLPSRPGDFKDIEEVTSHSETLSEGSSLYFNISTVDNSGNWSSSHESYGPMKVDLTQPDAVTLLTSSSHAPGVPSSNPTVNLSWTTASDNLSGIDGYGIYMASLAGLPSNVKDIEEVTSYSETLSDGTWYFNIRSVDNAGNWDSDFETYGPIIIDLPPVYSITPMTAGSPATFSVTGADPNSTVRLGYSLRGAGPFTTAFGVVDMTPPIYTLAIVTSNGNGDVSFTLPVPGNVSGRTLYTQGLNNGVLTNSLAAFIN